VFDVDFRRPLPGFQIRQLRWRCLEFVLPLIASGRFLGRSQRKQSGIAVDLAAASDAKMLPP